ncbi:MAG: hypothetical protein AB1422_01925, partial [bacterium]
FDEGKFLGMDKLPGIKLNEVAMHLATKLVAYDAMSAFRANVGENILVIIWLLSMRNSSMFSP